MVSILKRREILGFISGTAIASLVGCVRRRSAVGSMNETELMNESVAMTDRPNCVVKPEQTEGPYFVDERLNRSDIRSDPSDGTIREGVPLQLMFQVSQISQAACVPLRGAIVDVWHCDAEGVYSDVNERRFNTAGKQFLRGYQVTDANGTAQFTTIYPGWYPGRAVHIHFKIRTGDGSQPDYEFTSQLYFDEALTDQVYEQSLYQRSGQRTLNREDGIFQDGGDQLMLQLAPAASGYVGRFAIALESGV